MSPSHSRHSPPAVSDDDIVSVFLRIPPDDPARLFRASLVCKAWQRILTSPDFGRLYREFHRTPPTLGLVATTWSHEHQYDSRFVPTTAFRLKAADPAFDDQFDDDEWKAVDSRHGRVLVKLVNNDENFGVYVVWDPITNGQWGVPCPRIRSSPVSWNEAVLCARRNCDHLGCHGPPFLVAAVASDLNTTFACVYSSESGVWSDIITLKHPDQTDHSRKFDSQGRSILVGNTLHFPFAKTYSVLQYQLGEQKLSVIDVPDKNWDDDDERLVFISANDDVLVFAGWRGTSLSLWSAEAGASAWTRRTVIIDLDKLLPARAFESRPDYKPFVAAFAEGAVFLSTMAGLFSVELNSGRTKKVAELEMAFNVTPWTCFYTLDRARRMRPLP